MTQASSNFGIVGGGLLGLTLALRLAERGHRVTIFETADHLGGLADSWQLGDITWDRHYHVTLGSDGHLLRLLSDLDLTDSLCWSQTKTAFLVDRKLYSMSNLFEFLRFPPLRLIDKLRLGWTIWHASRVKDWKKLEQIPVDEWLIRHSGRRTFEQLWLPLLKAKLGDAWRRTSAAFIWATIQRMYAARDDRQKHEMFGYVGGGYATVLAAMAERLKVLGVRVECGFRVANIERGEQGEMIVTGNGVQHEFDRVVVTAPVPVASRLCPSLDAADRARLEGIEYLGIVCVSVLLKQPLTDYYVTNITSAAPFTGAIEMSALVEPGQLQGRGLIYLPKYATENDAIWTLSDEEVAARFLDGLSKLHPTFRREQVEAVRVSRARHVFALSTLNYSRRVPPVATRLPGLFLMNSAQIVNGTLNVNETVRLAESALDELLQPLPSVSTNTYMKGTAKRDCTVGELVARPR